MRLLLLAAVLACARRPSEEPPAAARHEAAPAATIAAAGRNVRGLVENMHAAAARREALLKERGPEAAREVRELERLYRADRAELLKQLALLEDWAARVKGTRASPRLERTLTPAGRAALGKRKTRAADFADAAAPSDLPFAP